MRNPRLAVYPSRRSVLFATLLAVVTILATLPAAIVTSGASTGFTVGIAADMRNYAGSSTYNSPTYYRGALEAMKAHASPAFLLSPGDVDPPANVKWTNDQVLGSAVQWFPVVGNHEVETASDMAYLRSFNLDSNGPGAEPNVVNPGPSACPQTTYSFDYQNAHFAVLNVYCTSSGDAADHSLGGDVPDYLYNWLAADLAASTKQFKFVVGHSPAYVQADQDSGRVRHTGESLDAHPANRDRFWSLLKSQGVVAYIVGHTHDYSAVQIGGVWQLDAGHARGAGDTGAPSTFVLLSVSADGVTFDAYRENYQTADSAPNDYQDIVHHGTLRGSTPPASTPASTPTAAATRTNTPQPTSTPLPTNTPTRTSTPVGTATNTPTRTSTPVGTATNTPTSGGSVQPIHAAFFYPWFPGAWTQQGTYPYSNYTPSLGYYSSTDDAIIDQQLGLAATAHLDAFISSWWGQGDRSDTALQHILARSARTGSPNPSLRWAIYYENESLGDPSSAQILSDLQYLQANAFSSPAYLRVNGKPVVFVYADAADAGGMAQRWAQAKAQLGGNVYVVLKVYPGYVSDPNQPDSWHQYSPAVGYDTQAPYAASVSPGFWLKGQAERLVRDPVRFESDVKRMVASNATWQLVTTWSEWGEGTIVEPSQEFGYQYIDILCRNLPGTAPCPGTGTPPTSTPIPTSTPVPTSTPPPTTTPNPAAALAWYPSIQQLLSTSADVVWTTNGTGAPTVRYSTDLSLSQVASGTSKPLGDLGTTQHRVSLTGLSPNTTYNYKVYLGGTDLTPGRTFSFKTGVARGASDPFNVIAFGDYGYGNADQIGLRNQMAKDSFDFILTTGDNDQNVGSYQDYDAHVFDVYTDLFSRVGLYPTVGNHDYLTSSAGPYKDIFDLPNGSTNYSFDYGQVHFVSIDEEAPLSSGVTATWLDQDLASTTQPVKVVALHQPAYSTGTVNPVDTRVQTQIIPILEKYKVDLVLQGHNHIYERSNVINGVTYVEVSTGAKVSQPCTAASWVAVSICSPTASLTSIYAKLQVAGTTITLDAIDQNGAVRDHVVISKSAQPPTPTPTATPAPLSQMTLVPTADSWVDSANPTVNYGTSAQVRVDGSPTVRSYLTFNVQGVTQSVSKATLRFYANSASSSGVSVRGLANPSTQWAETALNYNNAPAIAATITRTSPAVAAGTWISLDVTPLVIGNGNKQIVLTTTGVTAISLASRHSGANAPQLIVEYR